MLLEELRTAPGQLGCPQARIRGRGRGRGPSATYRDCRRSRSINPHPQEAVPVRHLRAQFATGDYRAEWLIEHVLVKNQPAGIAGPSKTLKTGLSLDAAISLASGTKFLGEFWVPKAARTASPVASETACADVARDGSSHPDVRRAG